MGPMAYIELCLEVFDLGVQGSDVIYERFEMLLSASLLGSLLAPCALEIYSMENVCTRARRRDNGRVDEGELTSDALPVSRQGPQTGTLPSHLLFLVNYQKR